MWLQLIEIIKNDEKEPYWKATDVESDVCIALFFEREWLKRIHEAGK